jgi:GT2 family glycosyltransferase
MIKVSVIIVNWNGLVDTVACLESLRRVSQGICKLEIVVVDNASEDDSVKTIKNKFPEVKIIENKYNSGFAGGNNIGIKFAQSSNSDFIWLLNNDTEVDPKVLTELVGTAEKNPEAGIIGSKIYFYAGREYHLGRYAKSELGHVIWYVGGVIDWKNMYASHKNVDDVDVGQFNTLMETDYVTGCSMFVRSSVFMKIGLLDEKYFMYLEDLDFCLRAKQAGFKLFIEPKSILWHKNSGSTAKPGNSLHVYYQTRNRLLIGFKYAPIRTKVALIRESLRFLGGSDKMRKTAVWDALTGRFGQRLIWKKIYSI